jgi:hypothetical protein
MDNIDSDTVAPPDDLAEALRDHRPRHPALSRLHDQAIGAEVEQITSYDRMHHRHNRS